MLLNVKLLMQMADVIEHHPDNYDQEVWSSDAQDLLTEDRKGNLYHQAFVPLNKLPFHDPAKFECPSRCCAAGLAVALTPVDQRPGGNLSMPNAATILLGLPGWDADVLFHSRFKPVGMSMAQALRKIANDGHMLDAEYYTLRPDRT